MLKKKLAELKLIDTEAKKFQALNYLYDISDELWITLGNKTNSDVTDGNIFITEFLEMNFSFRLHIALLSVTMELKDILTSRKALYKATVKAGMINYNNKDVISALYGLE